MRCRSLFLAFRDPSELPRVIKILYEAKTSSQRQDFFGMPRASIIGRVGRRGRKEEKKKIGFVVKRGLIFFFLLNGNKCLIDLSEVLPRGTEEGVMRRCSYRLEIGAVCNFVEP